MKKHIPKKRNKKKHALPSRSNMNGRILVLGSCVMFCLVFLLIRVGSIKLTYGEKYEKIIANRMVEGERDIKPQRGAIVDRNNKTLATSVLTYNIVLSAKDLLSVTEEKRAKVYETLATHLEDYTVEELEKYVEANPTSQYKVLYKKMDSEQAEVFSGLAGVSLEQTYDRKYPKGTLAAQLLGYFNKNEEGKYGIEQQYNDYLEGTPGRVFSQYQDAQIVTKEVQSAKNGATVRLTIDEVIQQYVENTMQKYIEEHNPESAAAVIMNPNTGEIYSMYSYPEFDPNTYNDLTQQIGQAAWEKLSTEEMSTKLNEAWINRAVQYTYEPGSTFKPIFVAAALDEGIIDGTETYNCLGYKIIGDRRISCHKKSGHGVQTLEEALANSCNVAMMEISEKIDSDVFLSYMERYGFGQITEVGLPGENAGLLHKSLSSVDKATYSMGQSMTVTPLQLINAFSAVINGGYLLEPYVVSQIVSEEDGILYNHEERLLRQVISSETSKKVAHMLKKVIDDGTGSYAAVNGYDIGGKTGTAQKLPREDNKYVLSFMGYAPINNPQVVGLVLFDDIPEGTGAPAKAFRDIMENVLPYLEIELSKVVDSETKVTTKVPDILGQDIYTAINKLEAQELDYEIVGVGNTVTQQYPKAETTVSKGASIKLYVETENKGSVLEVPDLTGMTIEEAKVAVENQFTVVGDNGQNPIISQKPKAGTKIEKNSQVIVKTTE